jgi:hypothetical protein
VHNHRRDQPERVDEHVPLAAHKRLTAVIAPRPPSSVVLTDRLSMIAADGCRGWPSARLGSPRNASRSRSKVRPPSRCGNTTTRSRRAGSRAATHATGSRCG